MENGGHSREGNRLGDRAQMSSSGKERQTHGVPAPPFFSAPAEAWVLGVPGESLISRSAAFPRPRGAPGCAPAIPLTELPVVRRERRPGAPSPPLLFLRQRSSTPLKFTQPVAKALVGMEVIWSAEVVRKVGVRAAPIRGPPAVLAAPERPPVWAVLGAAALLMPPLWHWAHVVVWRAPGVTCRRQSCFTRSSRDPANRPASAPVFQMHFIYPPPPPSSRHP